MAVSAQLRLARMLASVSSTVLVQLACRFEVRPAWAAG